MQIFKGIEGVQEYIQQQKRENKTIGLVPTMGALHAGHLSLLNKAKAEVDLSMASIFVNPLQFNNVLDLKKYPRNLSEDLELLKSNGCDIVFCPEAQDMYQVPTALSIDFGNLDKILEGQFRPGHFSGVGIVVAKLLNIIQPSSAYFGQKDYQQFLIIQQLVRDLNFPTHLVCGEIIREEDGLALSSRNQRLSPKERQVAPLIFQTLVQAKELLKKKSMNEIKQITGESLKNAGLQLEYFELADRSDLSIMQEPNNNIPSLLLIAAFVGDVRLIDNLFV